MPDSDFRLSGDEAEAIGRISALEALREQARLGKRDAMLQNIEKLITAELRAIQRMRAQNKVDNEQPQG